MKETTTIQKEIAEYTGVFLYPNHFEAKKVEINQPMTEEVIFDFNQNPERRFSEVLGESNMKQEDTTLIGRHTADAARILEDPGAYAPWAFETTISKGGE